MDFAFDEAQDAIRGLAKKMLGELITEESLRQVEAGDRWMHDRAWQALAQAELLGLALPESVGGGGMGMVELALLMHQAGRTVAPLPLIPTLALGALPIARFGTAEQQQRWLAPVLRGEAFLTAALAQDGRIGTGAPTIEADADGLLHGVATYVPAAQLAPHALVPAATAHGRTVFVVDLAGEGVDVVIEHATNGEPMGRVTFAGAKGERLGDAGAADQIVGYARDCAVLASCAMQLGVAEQAMIMTAKYAGTREQFGQPIGAFQAVSQRLGDAYIDVAAMRVTLWQAAWTLDAGHDATRALAIARITACDGAHRVVAAAQHIHGGMGFDRDYPLYRYFLTAKRLEFALGGASAWLATLGRVVAESAEAV